MKVQYYTGTNLAERKKNVKTFNKQSSWIFPEWKILKHFKNETSNVVQEHCGGDWNLKKRLTVEAMEILNRLLTG